MITARSFSTVSRIAFQKESVVGSAFNAAENTRKVGLKWNATYGNSSRTFAEYRLKACNQSPLAVKLKARK